ncbi:MnhB domain-containing protein [Pontibacter actiniarum]|uniref:Cation:proton antiporter n=1 Tax=Pontibacter actiniarum TaxID=323450 RepID=A0A1X9YQC2_9BACT|nr:MnhB domain-containing protein [Pontibacter actiniarum]ARS35086.1 cation:proton antiporter [Pontibacter actiniarum]
MRTMIFATAIRLLTPVFLLFSVYILFRGHNHPGGGFIGGLIGSIAFVFHVLAHGAERTANSYFRVRVYYSSRNAGYSRAHHALRLVRVNVWNRRRSLLEEGWQFSFLQLRPVYLMALGLFLAVTSGVLGLLLGEPYMAALWLEAKLPLIGSVGTPILFDAGVYLLVLGMVLTMVFTMSKE